MKRSVLKFGVLGGVISAAWMAATTVFSDRIGFDKGAYFGYTGMLLAFLMVYFGVRNYRERACGGQISFWRALGVGALMMGIICLFYVAAWEVIYYNFMPDFLDKYEAYTQARARAAGASAAALAKQAAAMAQYREMYRNPLTNAAITLLEPLPVGLVVTLVSAIVLRRKPKAA